MLNLFKNLFGNSFGNSEESKSLEREINSIEYDINRIIKKITFLLHILDFDSEILKKYSRLVFETQTEYHYGEGTDSLNYKKSHLKETLDECYELEREIRDGVFSQKSEEWKEIFLSLPEGESISFTSVEDGEYFLWYKRISENQFQKLVAGNMSTIGNVYDEGILDFDQVLGSSSGYFLDSILGRRKFEIRKDPLTLRKELSETK